ncbi:MAG: ribonuclease N1 [Nocardioidaceae bacterium]|nr:ribonuclease N1 [Nocardioidaceae bacterium]
MKTFSTVLVVLLALGVWWVQQGESERGDQSSQSQTTTQHKRSVVLAELPPEAARTVALIDKGGPFPYPGKDGSTFGNFEGLLPQHRRGYYAEYTVPTPGVSHRGARRIIAGDGGELYWTQDHYESFARIRR